jgi:hypothetical protein
MITDSRRPVHVNRLVSVPPCLRGATSPQTGNALITVLIMLAALTPLGAFAVMQARLDVMVQHHVREAAAAFYAAEAGLEHALADLRLDPSFERLVGGPDGVPGTGDDMEFPFRGMSGVLPIGQGYRYDLRVEPRSATRIEVIATSSGPTTATHAVIASIARDRALLPGAIATAANVVRLDLGDSFQVSGVDHAGRDPAQPALALGDEAVARATCAQLSSDTSPRLRGAGSAPSVAARTVPPVESVAGALAANRTATVGPVVNGNLGSGVTVSDGTLDVGTAAGSGVFIINGNLRVTGELLFTGLLIALGDVVFDSGSVVQLTGGLLQGRGNGVLALLGDGEIAYDSRVIDQIDRDFPGVLPHRAWVTGWRDQS